MGLYCVSVDAGVQGNEIADNLTKDHSVQKFVQPEPSLGKTKCWMNNQHLVMWHSLSSTKRQAQKLISGPSPTTKTKFLYFNRTQSRVVTGHNNLRRHLHLMGLTVSHLCRGCGTQEETSAHILCECDALASLRRTYLVSFFLDPEEMKSLSLGAIWNFNRGTGLP